MAHSQWPRGAWLGVVNPLTWRAHWPVAHRSPPVTGRRRGRRWRRYWAREGLALGPIEAADDGKRFGGGGVTGDSPERRPRQALAAVALGPRRSRSYGAS